MANERSFDGVSAALWAEVRAYGERRHGTVYSGAADAAGTATTRTVVGEIVLAYTHDPAHDRVTYRIERKPMLVAATQIWDGIARAIEDCRSEENRSNENRSEA